MEFEGFKLEKAMVKFNEQRGLSLILKAIVFLILLSYLLMLKVMGHFINSFLSPPIVLRSFLILVSLLFLSQPLYHLMTYASTIKRVERFLRASQGEPRIFCVQRAHTHP